jgi:hypothetical protein
MAVHSGKGKRKAVFCVPTAPGGGHAVSRGQYPVVVGNRSAGDRRPQRRSRTLREGRGRGRDRQRAQAVKHPGQPLERHGGRLRVGRAGGPGRTARPSP